MTAWRHVDRANVAQYVGDLPDRAAAVAALRLPPDGIARRDPESGDPQLQLAEAPPNLPSDGYRHAIGPDARS
jgi:hypothetical protein